MKKPSARKKLAPKSPPLNNSSFKLNEIKTGAPFHLPEFNIDMSIRITQKTRIPYKVHWLWQHVIFFHILLNSGRGKGVPVLIWFHLKLNLFKRGNFGASFFLTEGFFIWIYILFLEFFLSENFDWHTPIWIHIEKRLSPERLKS